MDKKGALFHWIILGILVAVGTFFVWSSATSSAFLVKGLWHTDFLQETVVEQQKEQVLTDLIARRTAQEALLDYTNSGGILERNECSVAEPFPLWNTKDMWCLPNIQEDFVTDYSQKLGQTVLGQFSNILLKGSTVRAGGEEIQFQRDKPFYIEYSPKIGLSIDTGYSTAEFDLITAGAQDLVKKCQNRKDLENCISAFELNHNNWNRNICDSEEDRLIEEAYLLYRQCLDSDDTDCFCNFVVDDLFTNGQKVEFTTLPNRQLRLQQENIEYTIPLEDAQHLAPTTLEIENGGKLFFDNSGGQLRDYHLNNLAEVSLHKYTSNGKTQLDFVKVQSDKLITWNLKEIPKPTIVRECVPRKPRIQHFCVDSSKDTKLFDEFGELQPVQHKFSLDFTPTEPFVITEFGVGYVDDRFHIAFQPDSNADSYNIHFTDYTAIVGSKGSVQQLAKDVKFGGFWGTASVRIIEQNCPAVKQPNTAYSCDGKVLFVLEDSRITEGEYIFTVTTVQGGSESRIEGFLSGSVS